MEYEEPSNQISNEPVPNQEPQEDTEESFSVAHEIFEWAVVIAIALAVLFFVKTFVAEPFKVPSGSMLETIQLDDRVLAEKISYRFRAPKQGEVIIFHDPSDYDTFLVKRVIATAGQTVDMRDGIVYVDGVALSEDAYTLGKPSAPLNRHDTNLTQNISYPYTVPENHFWAMGDNRTSSLDSRYFGPVPYSNIEAHAILVTWPLDNFKTL